MLKQARENVHARVHFVFASFAAAVVWAASSPNPTSLLRAETKPPTTGRFRASKGLT